MNEDDIRLLAYVDETLPAAQRAEVEAAITASPALTDAVESLRASRLPYRETFAAQVMPPVPERLSASLEALLRAHALRQMPVAQGTPDVVTPRESGAGVRVDDAHLQPAANDAPTARRVRVGWLAAAFAAGVATAAVILPLLLGVLNKPGANGAGLVTASAPLPPSPPPKSPQGTTWVRAAAEYQQLYARDTIASVRVDDGDTERTVHDIRQNDKLDINVPDLRSQGLTFKRVQRLRWQDRALVQMVYLPETGDPVALCVVSDPRPDQGVAEQTIDRMGVVTWRKGQIGYALIGAPGSVDLKAVAKGLEQGPVAPLYGLLMLPALTQKHSAS
jgi:anti-sigma factor RsiW